MSVGGVITTTADVDVFRVEPSLNGRLTIQVTTPIYGTSRLGMLDPKLRVLNFLGEQIAMVNSGLDENYSLDVVQQPYYIEVASNGNYGDIGQYSVTATLEPNLAAGQEDPTFSGDGLAFYDRAAGVQTGDVAHDVAVQPDGKIVVVGEFDRSDLGLGRDFGIVRFNQDGSIDTTFGSFGAVNVDFDTHDDVARAVVVLPDGDIFVAGETYYSLQGSTNMGVLRLSSSGALEAIGGYDFGSSADGDDVAYDAALDASGRIVLAGLANGGGIDHYPSQVGLIRLNAQTLNPDPTFGSGGKFTFNSTTSYEHARSLAIQPDGDILIAGTSKGGNNGGGDNWLFGRVLANGTLDAANFGYGGTRVIDFVGGHDQAYAITAQPDGKVIIGGRMATPFSVDFCIARYTANGWEDGPYGGTGSAARNFDFGGHSFDFSNAMVLQSDGKAVLAGSTNNSDFGALDTGLVRVTAGGLGDTSFGPYGWGGQIIDHSHTQDDQTNAAVLDGDGRIVTAGYAYIAPDNDFAVGRVLPGQYPRLGIPFAPGQTIQAEDFDNGGPGVAYNDTTPNANDSVGSGVNFSGHRAGSGVDIERDGAQLHLAYTHPGEWVEYSANVPGSGNYLMQFRVASPGAGARFHVEVNGVNVTGSILAPNTGGFLNFTTTQTSGFPLAAGVHTFRVVFDTDVAGGSSGFAANLDWLQLEQVVLPAWVAPGSVAVWEPSSQTLTVTGPTTIIADPQNSGDEPFIEASGSGAVVTINPAPDLDVHVSSLHLSNQARAVITSLGGARTAANHRVLVLDLLTIDASSKLDITDNDLIVDYTGTINPAIDLEAKVASGYNGIGDWLGNGITSSVAQLDGNFTVAVADNVNLAAPFGTAAGGPLFAGIDVDLTTVLVKFTNRADINLDGLITPDDAAIFGTKYDESITSGFTWAMGDLNYDGVCTPDDAAIFGTFYDESLPLV